MIIKPLVELEDDEILTLDSCDGHACKGCLNEGVEIPSHALCFTELKRKIISHLIIKENPAESIWKIRFLTLQKMMVEYSCGCIRSEFPLNDIDERWGLIKKDVDSFK